MEKSIFEQNGGTYVKVGDYYVPDFGQFEKHEEEQRPIGRYGNLRKAYLKEHKKALYSLWLMNGELAVHLAQVDEQARYLLDTMIPKLKVAQGVTDEMKMKEQMKWVGMMNNIRSQRVLYKKQRIIKSAFNLL